MSHADQVSKLPKNFRVIASSQNSKFAMVENQYKKFYGVQFHPEVTHTENGKIIISNFIFLICKVKKNWSVKNQKIKLIKEIRDQVGNKKVTKQNLKIIEIDLTNNLLIIKGSVPGKKNSVIFLKDSVKR